jgi:hypothetical protein
MAGKRVSVAMPVRYKGQDLFSVEGVTTFVPDRSAATDFPLRKSKRRPRAAAAFLL